MMPGFKEKGFFHKVAVKFVQAFLPDAKKQYYLRTAVDQELDIRGVAAMAEQYNILTKPDVIVEGFNAGIELMFYLAATGVRIKTPLFSLRLKFPGEYDGTETQIHENARPVARIQPGFPFTKYLEENVNVEILGKIKDDGFIAEAYDEASGFSDEVATVGNILTLHGTGLKIDADPDKKVKAGVFFVPEKGKAVKADIIAVNEPRTLKVVVPYSLEEGRSYHIEIVTQRSAKSSSWLLKNMRAIRSDFSITVRK